MARETSWTRKSNEIVPFGRVRVGPTPGMAEPSFVERSLTRPAGPWMTMRPSHLVLAAVVAAYFASAEPGLGQSSPEKMPTGNEALPSTMHCPVEGHEVATTEYGVRWKGRRYYLGTQICQEKFLSDPEVYARAIEPRSALFQAQDPSNPRYGTGFLYAGIVVVLGFVFGGLVSYIAVQKGHPGHYWFAAGFFLNVVGIAWIASKPSLAGALGSPGLTKIPQTHPPRSCGQCGAQHHPSARRCLRCGQSLEPSYESEAQRIAD